MATALELGGITLEVVRKRIRNVHLSVYPPAGRVRIAAPSGMSLETIRLFAISKLGWIRRQQKKLLGQERETRREFLNRESHYVWGRRLLLKVVEEDAPQGVQVRHDTLLLRVRPGADAAAKAAVLAAWYRQILREAAQPLIEAWEPRLSVELDRFFVQQMKTKWGSCNPAARSIRLNTELARKSPRCLEYIVVHELIHLLERRHNERFIGLMDRHLPHWRALRDELKAAPPAHTTWGY